MRTCKVCGTSEAEARFRGPHRQTCYPCELVAQKARSASKRKAEADFEITVDVDPLTAAEQAHEARAAKRDLHKEHSALYQENKRLRAELAQVAKMQAPPSLTIIERATGHHGDAVACAIASDWHVEEEVESVKVHGINGYNLEIAEARAKLFFQNTLKLTDMMARETEIKTLWLGLLGDFFSNYIHEELREANLLGPGEAALFVSGLLRSGIDFLLRESSYNLAIDCVSGNHGRMTLKPRIQQAAETSLETYMFHEIATHYRELSRVSFRVAPAKMLYRQFFERFKMRIIHGDDVKFGGGVGGITIPIRKKLAAWDKATRADLTVMGHFHQLCDGGDFIVNGSLIGYNEFAQAIGASPEQPRQAFFLIHARNGGEKSITAPIWLDSDRRRVQRESAPEAIPDPDPTVPS